MTENVLWLEFLGSHPEAWYSLTQWVEGRLRLAERRVVQAASGSPEDVAARAEVAAYMALQRAYKHAEQERERAKAEGSSPRRRSA